MRAPVRVLIASVAALLGVAVTTIPAKASNDPGFGRQWGIQDVQAPAAWSRTDGNGITIAVIDSGVDVDHPDLKGKLVPGRDFGDNDNNPDDDSPLRDGEGKQIHGHGTHVAGIAAAMTENGIGVAGVARSAKIMPLKVFPSNENSSLLLGLAGVPSAIRYAVDNGARVINLSLGGLTGLSLVGYIETPCADAYARGALCVVASGNSGQNNPSGYKNDVEFLNVTAHERSGRHAGFGQKADTQWSVSAPGVDIYSTLPVEKGSYGPSQGTSMAAPHAAGVAALLFAQGLSVGQVVERILSTATPMGDPGTNGAGRINAANAVGVVPSGATTVPTSAPITRRSGTVQRGATGGLSTGSATNSTIPTGTLPPDAAADDVAFAGGPSGNTKLTPATARKKAQEVSLGTMFITLGVLGVFGVGWGAISFTRRRGAGAAQLPSS